jgi:hypothetical protein
MADDQREASFVGEPLELGLHSRPRAPLLPPPSAVMTRYLAGS